jgi:dTDP-4-dehydrorhamnose reductase
MPVEGRAPKRILIVGAGGQVGAQLSHLLNGRAVLSTRSDGVIVDLERVVEHRPALLDRLQRERVDAIVCVGGMTDVERCDAEPERALRVNAAGPGALAEIAARLSAAFVYFSTDYVFDGKSGPYVEDAEPNPISAYGRSKLAGERAIRDSHPSALIVRTTVVFGPDRHRKNFVYGLLKADRSQLLVRGDNSGAKRVKSTGRDFHSALIAGVVLQRVGQPGWLMFVLETAMKWPQFIFTPYVGRRLLTEGWKLFSLAGRSEFQN